MCNNQVKEILDQAKHDVKYNYSVYQTYQQRLFELEISEGEYFDAIRKLCKILGV